MGCTSGKPAQPTSASAKTTENTLLAAGAEKVSEVQADTVKLAVDSWSGEFGVDSRTNWGAWLGYLGVPEAAWEAASNAPDFHKYQVTQESFVMDHQIPAQSVHLHFKAAFDGEWHKCPYPQPTATLWKEEEHKEGSGKAGEWRNKWLEFPTKFQTEIINFAGKGNTVHMVRELRDGADFINFEVTVVDPATETVVCGPFTTVFKRISNDTPGELPEPEEAVVMPQEAADSVPLVETPEPVEPLPVDAAGETDPSKVDVQATLESATLEEEEAQVQVVAEVAVPEEAKETSPNTSAEQTSPTRKERQMCC